MGCCNVCKCEKRSNCLIPGQKIPLPPPIVPIVTETKLNCGVDKRNTSEANRSRCNQWHLQTQKTQAEYKVQVIFYVQVCGYIFCSIPCFEYFCNAIPFLGTANIGRFTEPKPNIEAALVNQVHAT